MTDESPKMCVTNTDVQHDEPRRAQKPTPVTPVGRVRTRYLALTAGGLAATGGVVESVAAFGPTATAIGAAGTAVAGSAAYVAAKRGVRRGSTGRRSNPAGPGTAARRGLLKNIRGRAGTKTSGGSAGRKLGRRPRVGTPGWSAGRRPRPRAATQRARTGRTSGLWRPLGPQRRDRRGRFASGHLPAGASPARRRARRSIRRAARVAGIAASLRRRNPAAAARSAARRAARAQTRPRTERRAQRRAARQQNRTVRTSRRTARAQNRLARSNKRLASAERRNQKAATPARDKADSRPRLGAIRRVAGIAGRAWVAAAVKLGNGVRSGRWFQALAAPFGDLRPLAKPATATQPKPKPEPKDEATATPARPPRKDGLPHHPVTAKAPVFNRTPKAAAPVAASTTATSGGNTMSDTFGLYEAAAQVTRWHPNNPVETENMLRTLPEAMREFAKAFEQKGAQFASDYPYKALPEFLTELGKALNRIADTAEPMRGEYARIHHADLERHKNPRPNEEHMNVS